MTDDITTPRSSHGSHLYISGEASRRFSIYLYTPWVKIHPRSLSV